MKHKNIELDVDFIGGQGLLTKAEELAISNYFKSQKTNNSIEKSSSKLRAKSSSRKKVIA